MLGETLGEIGTFKLHFEGWLGLYQVDKMGLDILGKRNSLSMNLKAHAEMHSFNNKRRLYVLGIGHIMMTKTSTLPVPESF